MKIAAVTLESLSPYCQSAYISEPKKDRENPRDYEERTWRLRIHENESGNVFIPPVAFQKALSSAAGKLGMKIPGRGTATYKNLFLGGILVPEAMVLPIKASQVEGQRLLMSATGAKGSAGGKSVERTIPTIRKWSGNVTFMILDEAITESVFNRHLEAAGMLVGIGQYRPENGGYCGRFKVAKCDFSEA